jgi:peptidoglycan biosynthesis protein MviN/MurJ (putative lipid II flippase)
MEICFGEELLFPYQIVTAFAAYFYILKMSDIRCLYAEASGLWWENRYCAIIESIVNIILNVVFVKLWGVLGIICATMISILVINFGYGSKIVFKYYFKNGKLGEFFVKHIEYFIVTCVTAFLTVIICSTLQCKGIVALISRSLICVILPNFIYYLIYRHTKEYKVSIKWLLEKMKLKDRF